MSDPFLGDIKIVGFNFAPRGWAQCDGQLVLISQLPVLFGLLGTAFGGDGGTTFALPDMRGRAPLHQGTGAGLGPRALGSKAGQDAVALTTAQIPLHTHQLNASSDGATATTPSSNLPATVIPGFNVYGDTANADGKATQVSESGNDQAHNNMQPYLTLNFAIALFGIDPTPSTAGARSLRSPKPKKPPKK